MLSSAVSAMRPTPPPVATPEPVPPLQVAVAQGEWQLISHGDHVTCLNAGHPLGVAIQLWAGSNGWLRIQTTSGQWLMYSDFTTQPLAVDFPAALSGEVPDLPADLHQLGNWTLTVSSDECLITHSSNEFDLVLHRASNGWMAARMPDGRERLLLSSLTLDDPYHVAPASAPTTRALGGRAVGPWALIAQDDHTLVIRHEDAPDGPLLRLWSGSNGWAHVCTPAGQTILFSDLSARPQAFDLPAAGDLPSVALADGAHGFGDWTFRRDGQALRVLHPRNDFAFVALVDGAAVLVVEEDDGGRTSIDSRADLAAGHGSIHPRGTSEHAERPATGTGPPPPVPPPATHGWRSGPWRLSGTPVMLKLSHAEADDAPHLQLWASSNGWWTTVTEAGAWIVWSHGGSQQQAMFTADAVDGPALDEGLYAFGEWVLAATPEGLDIEHPANPYTLHLPTSSAAWVEVRDGQGSGVPLDGETNVSVALTELTLGAASALAPAERTLFPDQPPHEVSATRPGPGPTASHREHTPSASGDPPRPTSAPAIHIVQSAIPSVTGEGDHGSVTRAASFGAWCLLWQENDLHIVQRESHRGVHLHLWAGSNGWFHLTTGAGQWVWYTDGRKKESAHDVPGAVGGAPDVTLPWSTARGTWRSATSCWW